MTKTPNRHHSRQHEAKCQEKKNAQLTALDALYRESIYPNKRWGIIARTVDNDEKAHQRSVK
jgi:hypothetical protein